MYLTMTVAMLALMLAAASASGVVGGTTDANMKDKDVRDALKFAVAQYNKKSKDAFVRTVSQVLTAKQQVVAGLKYTFTVKMSRTNCRKGEINTQCAIHKDPRLAKIITCKIVVWTQDWIQFIKVLEHTCL